MQSKQLSSIAWLNNKLVSLKSININVLAHSLHYSGCIFEGQRVYHGSVFKMQEHHERFFQSAKIMGIELPYDIETLNFATLQVIKANDLSEAYIRTVAWFPQMSSEIETLTNQVNISIVAWQWSYNSNNSSTSGLRVTLSQWRRPSPSMAPVQAKTSSLYTISILAKNTALKNGFSEALFLDHRGYVADCTISNIFFVKNKELYTPKAETFLNGITRKTVINLAKGLGIKVHEVDIEFHEIKQFDEAFITGTAVEIRSISNIDNHVFVSRNITLSIMEKYQYLVFS